MKNQESSERIRLLTEKIKDIRKVYGELKSEVANIDRKRKRRQKRKREGIVKMFSAGILILVHHPNLAFITQVSLSRSCDVYINLKRNLCDVLEELSTEESATRSPSRSSPLTTSNAVSSSNTLAAVECR